MGAPKLQAVQAVQRPALLQEHLEMEARLLVFMPGLEAGVTMAEVEVVVIMEVAAGHHIPREPF